MARSASLFDFLLNPLKKISRGASRAISIGLDGVENLESVKKMRMVHILTILNGTLSVFFGSSAFEVWGWVGWVAVAETFLYASVLVCSFFRRHDAARVLFLVVSNAVVFVFTALFGFQALVPFSAIPIVASNLMVIERRRTGFLVAATVGTLACTIASVWIGIARPPLVHMPADMMLGTQIYTLFLSMLMVFGYTVYTLRENARVENALAATLDEVHAKSNQMRLVLENMSQGVFVLGSALEILPGSSKNTGSLLGRDDFEGKGFQEVFLSHSDLKKEALDQVVDVLKTSLGEELFNFELNCHLLPKKALYRRGEFERSFDVKIDPLTSREQTISGYLVTLVDKTEELAILKERERNELRMAKLMTIFEVGISQSSTFMSDLSRKVSDFSEKVKRGRPSIDFASEMRTLHTLKGNSRALGFKAISNAIHDLEAAALLFEKDAAPSDQVLAESSRAIEVASEYGELIRKFGSSEREHELQRMKAAVRKIAESLKDGRTDTRALLSLCNDSLGVSSQEITRTINRALPELCATLERGTIALAIPAEFKIAEPFFEPLMGIMTHLTRNSVDHGFPTGGSGAITLSHEEIPGKGKTALVYQDSGHGLDLGKIRSTALKNGLKLREGMTDLELASVIFEPGFTTAERVTHVSGRGVGMDAVRAELQSVGGTIAIELLGSHPEFPGKTRFRFRMVLPDSQVWRTRTGEAREDHSPKAA